MILQGHDNITKIISKKKTNNQVTFGKQNGSEKIVVEIILLDVRLNLLIIIYFIIMEI